MTSTTTSKRTIHAQESVTPTWAQGHAVAALAARQVAPSGQRQGGHAALHAMDDHQLRDIGLSRDGGHVRSLEHDRAVLSMGRRLVLAARRAGRAVLSGLRRLRDHHERRKAVHALRALGDHGLKDIGLHRSGIVAAVRDGADAVTGRPDQPVPPARRR